MEVVVLAVVNLPDPETSLTLWAAGFGVVTAMCLGTFQAIESYKQELKRRRKLAYASRYRREYPAARQHERSWEVTQ